jgi:hypothetical protein
MRKTMRSTLVVLTLALTLASCIRREEVAAPDTIPPGPPRGITTISLDNAVQLDWLPNTEPDIEGYRVWVSNAYNGVYNEIGTVTIPQFVDNGAINGNTYYYAVSAFDHAGNEGDLSKDVVYDTPRPEGYNVQIYDVVSYPSLSGYDFSTYSVGPYDDQYTDVYVEFSGVPYIPYLRVWSDTDIQDMGYTRDLDEISVAPSQGWSESRICEAIVGHTYVVWTNDDHYAKVRVVSMDANSIRFDWAYQTAMSNPELKRVQPPDGKRPLMKRQPIQ